MEKLVGVWWTGMRIVPEIKTACEFLQLSRSGHVVQYSCLNIHKEGKEKKDIMHLYQLLFLLGNVQK